VGMCTEKSRFKRSLMSLQNLMRKVRHMSIPEQVAEINLVLRGHYAYYGIAGNIRALQRVYRAVERYWCKILRTRSRASRITWPVYHQIKLRTPLLRPKLYLPYRELQALAVL
jgi:RNA-directed DNA polymerase